MKLYQTLVFESLLAELTLYHGGYHRQQPFTECHWENLKDFSSPSLPRDSKSAGLLSEETKNLDRIKKEK